MRTTGKPVGRSMPRTRHRSLTQMYASSEVLQATQSAASSPLRGGSTSTGAARFLTRMSPSKGKDGQRVKSGSEGVFSGTTLTLVQAARHCPGSISSGDDDGPSAVQVTQETSIDITFCGNRSTGDVIHRSYPQAAEFHVKHDVERLHPLWIPRWTAAVSSALFHVKRLEAGFSTAVAHSLWILPATDLESPAESERPTFVPLCGGSLPPGFILRQGLLQPPFHVPPVPTGRRTCTAVTRVCQASAATLWSPDGLGSSARLTRGLRGAP